MAIPTYSMSLIYEYLIVVLNWWLLHFFIWGQLFRYKDDVRYFVGSDKNFARIEADEKQKV